MALPLIPDFSAMSFTISLGCTLCCLPTVINSLTMPGGAPVSSNGEITAVSPPKPSSWNFKSAAATSMGLRPAESFSTILI